MSRKTELIQTCQSQASQPISPCIGVCQLDQARRFCQSCLRTIDEIRSWRTMTDDERWILLEKLVMRDAKTM